ncbi:MAG: hypothetical protein HY905_06560 [Deltaproteobacteria bacterium]|nr:hypothetical protein [Deltaproteobacteria bacterium]
MDTDRKQGEDRDRRDPPGSEAAVSRYDRDDDLTAAARDGAPRVRVYRPDAVSVVLGRGSRPELELCEADCAADAVPIRRRPGGGCAVVLDPGNVIVVAAIPQSGLPRIRELFASFTGWMLRGLARVGLGDVRQADVSDLVARDRKVGGASIYRPQGAALYGVSLLVEPRLDLMERYLKHPPREPSYRRGRRHADFVGRLADEPGGWTAERLAAALAEVLTPPSWEEPPMGAGEQAGRGDEEGTTDGHR